MKYCFILQNEKFNYLSLEDVFFNRKKQDNALV